MGLGCSYLSVIGIKETISWGALVVARWLPSWNWRGGLIKCSVIGNSVAAGASVFLPHSASMRASHRFAVNLLRGGAASLRTTKARSRMMLCSGRSSVRSRFRHLFSSLSFSVLPAKYGEREDKVFFFYLMCAWNLLTSVCLSGWCSMCSVFCMRCLLSPVCERDVGNCKRLTVRFLDNIVNLSFLYVIIRNFSFVLCGMPELSNTPNLSVIKLMTLFVMLFFACHPASRAS